MSGSSIPHAGGHGVVGLNGARIKCQLGPLPGWWVEGRSTCGHLARGYRPRTPTAGYLADGGRRSPERGEGGQGSDGSSETNDTGVKMTLIDLIV